MGLGELLSWAVVAAWVREAGIRARAVDGAELIVTDSRFQDETRQTALTLRAIQAGFRTLLGERTDPVVAGYRGATRAGAPTTLGRGGSDLSATLIDACLPASDVWIWTDVGGIFTADPRVVPGARPLAGLSCAEASELARFGAIVLHPRGPAGLAGRDAAASAQHLPSGSSRNMGLPRGQPCQPKPAGGHVHPRSGAGQHD